MSTQLVYGNAVIAVPNRRTALTVASACMLASFAAIIGNFGPLIAPTAARLHVSLVMAGLFPVVWSLCYIPGTVMSGMLLDRYGARLVLYGAGGLVLGCFLLLSVSLTFPLQAPMWLLLGLIGIAGFGGGGIDAGTNGFVSILYPKGQASILIIFNVVFPVGSTLVAVVDTVLLWFFPSDPRILLLFPTCMTAVSLMAFFVVSQGLLLPGQAVQAGILPVRHTMASTFSLVRRVAPVMVILLLAYGVGSCLFTWTPVYLQKMFILSSGDSTAVTSIIRGGTIVYSLALVKYVSRHRAERMLLFSLVMVFVGTLLLFSQRLLPDAGALLLITLGSDSIVALGLAIGTQWAGREQGFVAGLLLCCLGVGESAWSWMFAVVFNEMGPRWAVGICVLGAGAAVVIGLALLPRARVEKYLAALSREEAKACMVALPKSGVKAQVVASPKSEVKAQVVASPKSGVKVYITRVPHKKTTKRITRVPRKRSAERVPASAGRRTVKTRS